jgi:penicillin-binding protein 2
MALRIAVLGVLAVTIFCALFFRLWALQVISGERYLEDARNNQIRPYRAPAPRGSIVDRNGTVIVANVPGTLVQLWPAALEGVPHADRERMLRRLARLLELRPREIRSALAAAESDPLTPITIDESVGERKINYLLEHQAQFPGVQIAQAHLRDYKQGKIGAQILGYVGEVTKEQLKTMGPKGYVAGDRIGQTGVEASYDQFLRGTPGVGRVYVDALGRVTSARQFSQLPEAGNNIRLTIDAELQRTAEEALEYGIRLALEDGEWAADGGALVAMDPRNGEILALASNPSFDPSVYVGRVSQKDLKALAAPSANHPTLNRAVSGVYPPGSTFKPVTALAALQEGLIQPDELIQCTGKEVIDGQTFMNWDPLANEPMMLTTALAASCDTYFYQVAMRFYVREDAPLQKWARRFGFGRKTGMDLGPEEAGLVPTIAWKQRYFNHPIDKIWTSGDSVQLSIGQGDFLATPLQMTRF